MTENCRGKSIRTNYNYISVCLLAGHPLLQERLNKKSATSEFDLEYIICKVSFVSHNWGLVRDLVISGGVVTVDDREDASRSFRTVSGFSSMNTPSG